LARSSHEATADGSFGFISAAIRKLTNANTTIEPIHGPMREAQAYLTRRLRERDLVGGLREEGNGRKKDEE
jgi:hypothetical protein